MRHSPGLADALRCGTHQSHKDVEQAKSLKGIFADSFSLGDYSELISRWQVLFENLEPVLTGLEIASYRYRVRLPALDADLAALEQMGYRNAAAKGEPFWKPLNYESAVGACYVIEGSCLGAKLICKRLDEKLGQKISHAKRFYSLDFKRWPWFRQQLDRVGQDPSVDPQKVVSGARDCFLAIESYMG